jgi:hypothetical protein
VVDMAGVATREMITPYLPASSSLRRRPVSVRPCDTIIPGADNLGAKRLPPNPPKPFLFQWVSPF